MTNQAPVKPKIPPTPSAISYAARGYAAEALSFALETMRDEEAPYCVRLQAANMILERGFWQPAN